MSCASLVHAAEVIFPATAFLPFGQARSLLFPFSLGRMSCASLVHAYKQKKTARIIPGGLHGANQYFRLRAASAFFLRFTLGFS